MPDFLKKVDGDYLVKVDGDKIELAGVYVVYTLEVESGTYTITGSNVTLGYYLPEYVLTPKSGSYVITGSPCTLGFVVPRIETDWLDIKGEGPWSFTKQPNKAETPHSDGTCGYWWRGKTYDT